MSGIYTILLVALAGGAPLGVAIWSWRGRSEKARWWIGNPLNQRLILTILPACGAMGLPLGLMPLFEGTRFESLVDNAVLVPVILGAALAFWGFCFMPIPSWWGPKWFRQLSSPERKPATKHALDALTVAALSSPSKLDTNADGGIIYDPATLIGSWKVNYIADPDSKERAHGLASRGGISGRITAYETALVFAASQTENTLRGTTTTVTFDRNLIERFRVVPARAGADGIPRKGWMYRSMHPRLVMDTRTNSYVFEVSKASNLAARLTSQFVTGPKL